MKKNKYVRPQEITRMSQWKPDPKVIRDNKLRDEALRRQYLYRKFFEK